MTPLATDGPPSWELVIGLEVHCQLATASKIFCGCATSFGAAPNLHTCPVCLGLPGALPVLNGHAVTLAARAALALGCTVHPHSVFARKNYFYPDLPKGYQITQFDQPIATDGRVVIGTTPVGVPHAIRIHRVHLEEDAGKSVHDRFAGATAIDCNRAGTPLIEIVSEPDLRSAQEAGRYLRQLKQLLEYTEVSDANMEEGSLRVDVNISIRAFGAVALGTKAEIKNLNAFSSVERAIEVEFARQRARLESGGQVEQQTLLYDEQRHTLRPARSKEGSHDYRYFPEPDLPPVVLTERWIQLQRDSLPELPAARHARFVEVLALNAADAEQLTASTALAEYFELLVADSGDARSAAKWVLGPVLASVNAAGFTLARHPVSPKRLAALMHLEANGAVSNTAARQLFILMQEDSLDPMTLARREGLLQVRDDGALLAWIDQVFSEFPVETARFLAGDTRLQGVLVGQVMKKSGGAADPRKVNQLLAARVG